MNRLSSLFQFILGFFLGVFILAGGTAALGFIFFSRMAAPPPKPVFAEETKEKQTTEKKSPLPTKTETPVAKSQPETAPQEKEQKKEQLPAGAYKAKVTWPEGLSLRDQPGIDANRIGGLMYNNEIIVLETSSDGGWQKVRVPGSGQEGWVRGGNIAKIE